VREERKKIAGGKQGWVQSGRPSRTNQITYCLPVKDLKN
jgi:hypothetical protein